MKNEVNRTFTVKKNKFTNFLNCFYANTPQNTGGGNSHSSTVATPVWKGSRPTVSRRSTDSQSQDHRNHTPISKALKYAAMILMILTLGIGNAWGADYEVTLNGGTVSSNGITLTGDYVANAQVGNNSQKANSFNTNNSSAYIFSESTNITGISFKVCRASNGSSASAAVNVATSIGGVFAIPTSGFSATNNGTEINSLTGVTAVGNNQTSDNSIVITFTSPVKAVELRKSSASNIHDLVITYTSTTAPTEIFKAVVTGQTTKTVDPKPAEDADMTISLNSNMKTISDNKYHQWNGNNVINLGSTPKFQVGDQIVVDVCGSGNNKTVGFKVNSGTDEHTITLSATAHGEVCYTVKSNDGVAGQSSVTLVRKSSDTYVHSFRVLRASGGGCTNVGIGTQPTSPVAAFVGVASSITGLVASGTNPTYQWQTCNSDGSNAANISAAGAMSFTGYTSATLGLTPTAEGATYYKCVVSGDCGSPVTSNVVTVNASPAHTLIYNANGGTGSMANTVSAGTITLRANAYTKDGYVFAGWATSQANANAGTIAYADAATTYSLSADATLYAVWYTVYYSFAPTGEVSSTSLSANDVVASSTGGTMTFTPIDNDGSSTLKYTDYGVEYGKNSKTATTIALTDNSLVEGSIIVAKIQNRGKDKTRGLKLCTTGNGTDLTDGAWSWELVDPDTPTPETRNCYYTIGSSSSLKNATSFRLVRNNTAYLQSLIVAKWVAPEPSCAATVPGNISKGTASGGTGTITLTAAGEIASGDTWYWQSAEDGTATNLGDGATKNVNAVGTYYIRSYNATGTCWSAAKSVEVVAADLLTAISPTLSYATSNIVVGNTSSPTLEGNTGSGSVSYALNNVSPAGSLTINTSTGVVTAVTAGGTATVTATIAANGNYAAGEATSETITVVAPATGTATISYALSGSTTTGTVTGVSTISSLSSSLTLSTLTIGDAKSGYSGAIKGCTSETELVEDDYVDVQFTVASGYVFTPSEVSVKANPLGNTSNLKAVVKIMDAQPLEVASEVLSCTKNTDNLVTFASGAFTNKEFCGTVHIRIYFYGTASSKEFWIKSPITIAGTVAVAVTKYNLTFAAGTGASGSMSTLKYAEGAEVTLPACTFTAPSGKEFDAWVVTKTVGGEEITVTDGVFTMPAEAVTATATWKDRPKHTDATLSDLTVAGETVDDFDAATTSYNVELSFGTFAAPTVAATATDASYVKSVVVTQASSASGDATVVLTAEDGTTTKTYTIHFSVVASKNIELVWATDKQRCDGTTPTAVVKSDNAAVSAYINKIVFTNVEGSVDNGAEGSSLNVGKKAGNMLTLSAKPGYAFQAMSFYGKIESDDVKLEYSLDGGTSWNDLASTSGGDACYSDVFTSEEVHTLCMRSVGIKGFWIRNMQLTMIQACTPKTIAWTAEPAAEYELGTSPDAIAATANNGTITYASDDGDVIAVNSSNGALTLKALGSVTLSASVPAGDGAIYCDEGAQVSKASVKTYYLVTFDAQNETAATPVKYYSGDAAIALPSPSYSGYVFQGWFDAAEGGNKITGAITPTASRTVYAQWEAKCTGPTITTQPTSANYFIGRTASALTCEATPGVEGKALTYTWYSCDDAERTNPVELAGAPTPSTAAVGTFYYYCAVTEADCDVVRNSNVATIAVTEKDKVCLVKADLQAGDKNASISAKTGSYKDDANIAINIAKNLKLGETGNYVKLGVTGTSFANGDEVVITLVDGSTLPAWLQVFAGTGSDLLAERKSGVTAGANTLTISNVPANQKVLYLYRTSASGTNMNPYVQSMTVYRACPAPILEGISFNSTDAEADELNDNTFNVELTNGTNLASLEVVRNVMWVGAHATTPYTIITNEGSWAWGANTYRVMDKDGDYTDYTINLTEALPDAETPVIATDLTDHAYCAGEIPELDATANEVSDGGTLTYQWFNAEGAIEGAISATYTPEGEGSYYCKVTNTLAEHRPMSTTSATAELTQKAVTSISGDAEFDVEQGATVKFQPTITGANATYAWYACDAEGNHEGDVLGTSASYSTDALNTVGTFYYVLEVIADCGNASQVFSVTVSDLGGSLVAHRPGNYYGQTLKEYDGRYYEIYGMSRISSKNYLWAGAPISSSSDENCVMNLETTTEISWMKNALKEQGSQYSALSNKAQFTNPSLSNTYSMKYNQTSNMLVLKVKGYDQFSMVSKDANTSNKYLQVFIDGEERERASKSTSEAVYDFDLTDGEHLIVVRPSTSDNNYIFQFSLRLPVVATVDETDYLFVQDAIDAASDPVTITMMGNSYEDIVIANGKDVTIAGAGHTLNSITVEKGGKVNASSALTLVENFYLEAQAGASGQVLGATNLTANAVYMDVTFFKGATELDETTAGRWYMISAPFDVNLSNGFINPVSGKTMTFGQTDGENIFDLFEYDGNKRATTGVTGWKRVQGKMKAGRACLIGFNPGQPTTIRLKAASTVLSEPTSITLNAYDGDEANRNWNGVANPTMHYTNLNKDVQTYNNEDGENGRKYIAYSASSTSFVVGTAFFVQKTGTIDLSAASHSEFRAPQRQANERYEACVRIFRQEATDFADQMYVRASENASSEYEQGHDMITWNGTTANTALIWAENYGKRLAIEEAPLVNDKATYNLGIFAPIAGEYRIEAANPSEDATLYLTKNGRIFWNLTMGACELDLAQGQNNEYGLLLRAEAPAVTTGMDEIRSEAGVQKLIIDENVFILRGEKMYDVTGKMVK